MYHKSINCVVLVSAICFLSCTQHGSNTIVNETTPDISSRNNFFIKADLSAMDMSWFPNDYPLEKMKGNDSVKLMARVIYSRPQKKGRQIFGSNVESLCVYGKPWRLGANEATEITFFEDVTIGSDKISKGSYVLYCIPNENKWTVILNSNLYIWGLHIDERKDIFKIDIPIEKMGASIEDFTMQFQKSNSGANLIMAWDNIKASLPISFVLENN